MVSGSSSGEEEETERTSQAEEVVCTKDFKQKISSKKNSLLYCGVAKLEVWREVIKVLTLNQGEKEDGFSLTSVNGHGEKQMNSKPPQGDTHFSLGISHIYMRYTC